MRAQRFRYLTIQKFKMFVFFFFTSVVVTNVRLCGHVTFFFFKCCFDWLLIFTKACTSKARNKSMPHAFVFYMLLFFYCCFDWLLIFTTGIIHACVYRQLTCFLFLIFTPFIRVRACVRACVRVCVRVCVFVCVCGC